MKILRKIEKAVEGYEILLLKYPERAKKDKENYIEDLKLLIDYVEDYIKITSERLNIWYSINIRIFDLPTNNIFSRIRIMFNRYITDYNLKKISKDMSKAERIQKRLKKIDERFMQFKYFS